MIKQNILIKKQKNKSAFFFFLETQIKMSLELFRLLMNPLEYFICICIDIKVHFLIIMSGKLIRIIGKHIIDSIIIF